MFGCFARAGPEVVVDKTDAHALGIEARGVQMTLLLL